MENMAGNREWTQLTPEQKRDQRLQTWRASSEKISFINEAAARSYNIRLQRLIDVYCVREPDRVPVTIFLGSVPLYKSGADYHTGMYDYEKASAAYNKFNSEFGEDLDNFANPNMIPPGKVFDILDYKLYVWPGRGLPQRANGFQFVEGEYMKPGEYDDLIKNPSDFWMRTYLPRIFGSFDSFRLFDSLTDIIEIPTAHLMPLADPRILTTLQKLIDAGKELQRRAAALDIFNQKGLEAGFPAQEPLFFKAPFDIIGDTLRGTQGVMMDMYRCPDKLLAAMDAIADVLIKSTMSRANAARSIKVMAPLHKGADGWMSQKQFETFYWPSLRKVINAFIDEGLLVGMFAEGSFNTRLEMVDEFPRGFIHWWFDQTDMSRAKKVLGDKCCIQGNVPSSLLIMGTPGEVKEYSRRLIETCGPGGGYILSPGAADVEAKVENFRAMLEAVREYGVYKR